MLSFPPFFYSYPPFLSYIALLHSFLPRTNLLRHFQVLSIILLKSLRVFSYAFHFQFPFRFLFPFLSFPVFFVCLLFELRGWCSEKIAI